MKPIQHIPLEAILWIAGLILLAIMDPTVDRVSICPLHNLGFENCPGCGLGRSISYLFRGEFKESWNSHPLGAIAVVILTARILTLTKTFFYYGKNH